MQFTKQGLWCTQRCFTSTAEKGYYESCMEKSLLLFTAEQIFMHERPPIQAP